MSIALDLKIGSSLGTTSVFLIISLFSIASTFSIALDLKIDSSLGIASVLSIISLSSIAFAFS
ncbi:hypothetical protein FDC04_18065, partial [Clostridium botulinum]|nr:hypothetical protein [Clostridium botulinum]